MNIEDLWALYEHESRAFYRTLQHVFRRHDVRFSLFQISIPKRSGWIKLYLGQYERFHSFEIHFHIVNVIPRFSTYDFFLQKLKEADQSKHDRLAWNQSDWREEIKGYIKTDYERVERSIEDMEGDVGRSLYALELLCTEV